jgi:2'-5' RNA ligase
MKRIFIAIKVEPGQPFLNLITSLKSGLDRESIKWINVSNVHITLAFLGNTEESVINSLIGMLHEKCSGQEPFELNMKGTGVFRNFADPKVIWTGVDRSERLSELYKNILTGLNDLNIDPGDKPFNPHITLGRIKYLNDKGKFRNLLEKYKEIEIQKVPVNEVVLFESILLPAGPVYTPLKKIALNSLSLNSD